MALDYDTMNEKLDDAALALKKTLGDEFHFVLLVFTGDETEGGISMASATTLPPQLSNILVADYLQKSTGDEPEDDASKSQLLN